MAQEDPVMKAVDENIDEAIHEDGMVSGEDVILRSVSSMQLFSICDSDFFLPLRIETS